MASENLSLNQFLEGARGDIRSALLIIPIALAVVFLPLIDLAVGLRARRRP